MPRLSHRILAALVVLGAVAAGCGPSSSTALAAQGLEPDEDGWYGNAVRTPHELPAVTFTDVADDREIRFDEAFTGDPTLLFFGYTNCPDICPIHLAAIASSMRAAGIGFDELDVVFVSVDPERDSPERIREFVANFDARITGLHAELDVVAEALDALDMAGPVVEGPDPRGEGDLIGHPAQVIGFDADGVARRAWPFGARRSDWAADLPRVVDEWS